MLSRADITSLEKKSCGTIEQHFQSARRVTSREATPASSPAISSNQIGLYITVGELEVSVRVQS